MNLKWFISLFYSKIGCSNSSTKEVIIRFLFNRQVRATKTDTRKIFTSLERGRIMNSKGVIIFKNYVFLWQKIIFKG